MAGALILSAAPAAAKSYTLPDAEVDVRVAPDGSLQVRELITFDYAGSFSGAYRDMRRRWTPEAATEAARWAAFRRYLRDFPRLQEAPPASVALWERLLVYGIAFGSPSASSRRRRSWPPRSSGRAAASTAHRSTAMGTAASTRGRA